MIKSRTAQLIYLTVACTVCTLGTIASLGLFDNCFRWDFYTYFTNLSNYFCLAILLVELIATARRREDGYISSLPVIKFVGMVVILLTFLVYNFLLAPDRAMEVNLSFRSVSFHVLAPLLYVADWILFYEKGKIDWKYPFYALTFPACYFIFILAHAAILGFDTSIQNFAENGPLIYPYFFLDLEKLGANIIIWLGIIFVILMVLGYALFGVDKIRKKENILK